jgi:hypothetical protein
VDLFPERPEKDEEVRVALEADPAVEDLLAPVHEERSAEAAVNLQEVARGQVEGEWRGSP